MIIDGKAIAADILARAKARAVAHNFTHPPRVAAIVANDTPATRSYLAIKSQRAEDAGCALSLRAFPTDVSQDALIAAVAQIVAGGADAIIVQLPLPAGIDAQAVCDAIPVEKDADVLSSAARAQFVNKDLRNPYLLPPVVAAVREILMRSEVEVKNKKAVVIGEGWLVGKPAATWLKQEGAEVTVLNSQSENFSAVLQTADIIVSGAGSPHLIKPEMLKKAKTAEGSSPDGSQSEPFRGVVLIDAGTSESGGAIAGDADPTCAAKCSIFTPVPGGVGPIAVACLFDNAVTLAERK